MAEQKSQRWIAIGLAVVAGLAVLVAAGLYFGAKALKGKVEQALGPESEIPQSVIVQGLCQGLPAQPPNLRQLQLNQLPH